MKPAVIVKLTGLSAVLFGLVVITLWLFGNGLLNHSSIRFNTALCILFYGVALLLAEQRVSRLLIILTLTPVFVIAGLTFCQYLFNIDTGIDYLFLSSADQDGGRMFMVSSLCLLLLSTGLVFSTASSQTIKVLGQYHFHLVTLCSFVIVIGYLFDVADLFRLHIHLHTAWATACALFIVSLFSTFLNYDLGITGLFTGSRIGNKLIRQVYPFFLIALIALTVFRIQMHRTGRVEVEFGIVLFALSFIIVSLGLMAFAAVRINALDKAREVAVVALAELNANLERKVNERTRELKNANQQIVEREQRIRESHEMFTRLFQMSPVGMLISEGPGFPIKDVNEAFLAMVGMKRTEVVGKLIQDLGIVNENDLWDVVKELETNRIVHNHESVLFSRDNGQRICLASSILFTIDDTPRTFSTFMDITGRKEAEVKLKEALEELSSKIDHVNELNAHLEHSLSEQQILNDKLQITNQEKDNLVAIVSHDLRNPIAGIASVARILGSHSHIPSFAVPLIKVISDSCDDIMILATNLLDLNRLERGRQDVHFSEFELGELFRKLFNSYDFRAKSKNISFRIFNELDDDAVFSDQRIVYRVLENLVSNAIKFTPQNGKVTLSATDSFGRIKLTVIDNGPGIRQQEQHLLFKKFTKLSNYPTGDEPSTGLGLSIVKELCTLLHADLMVKSAEGAGSEFTFMFNRRLL